MDDLDHCVFSSSHSPILHLDPGAERKKNINMNHNHQHITDEGNAIREGALHQAKNNNNNNLGI